MVELAVNVVHAFATLLPDAAENETLVARAPGLVRVLPKWFVCLCFVHREKYTSKASGAAVRRLLQLLCCRHY